MNDLDIQLKKLAYTEQYGNLGVRKEAEVPFTKQPKSLQGLIPDFIPDVTNPGAVGAGYNAADIFFRGVGVGGQIITVPIGSPIQKSIDDVAAAGGGECHLMAGIYKLYTGLTIPSNVALVGAGRGITFLDFQNLAIGIQMVGTLGTYIVNTYIADFTLQNSNTTAGLDIQYSKFFRVENIRIEGSSNIGMRIRNSQDCIFDNTQTNANTLDGTVLVDVSNYSFRNSDSSGNTNNGFFLDASIGIPGSFFACTAVGNGANGFSGFTSGSNSIEAVTFFGCKASSNGNYGFFADAAPSYYFGCEALSNGLGDYQISVDSVIVGGNSTIGKVVRSGLENNVLMLTGADTRNPKQFSTGSGTLANVPGLSISISAAGCYRFDARLHVTADVTGGSKYAINGTATANNIIYEIWLLDNTSNLNTITSRQTALGGSAGQAGTTSGYCTINGVISVNAAGAIRVQFAQNSASGTSSVLIGSTFSVTQIA